MMKCRAKYQSVVYAIDVDYKHGDDYGNETHQPEQYFLNNLAAFCSRDIFTFELFATINMLFSTMLVMMVGAMMMMPVFGMFGIFLSYVLSFCFHYVKFIFVR